MVVAVKSCERQLIPCYRHSLFAQGLYEPFHAIELLTTLLSPAKLKSWFPAPQARHYGILWLDMESSDEELTIGRALAA